MAKTKKVVILNFELEDEPNEDRMTSIEIEIDGLKFNSFAGFEARDIYTLVTKGENK